MKVEQIQLQTESQVMHNDFKISFQNRKIQK